MKFNKDKNDILSEVVHCSSAYVETLTGGNSDTEKQGGIFVSIQGIVMFTIAKF